LPFDGKKGDVTGEPFLIASDLGHPSISLDGTMIHAVLRDAVANQLVVVSRDGALKEILTETLQGVGQPAVSPDGNRIAYSARESQNADIFVVDRTSGITSRLTLSPEQDVQPRWIPGTEKIAFISPSEDCNAIWVLNADGTGQPELIIGKAAMPTFGPDGKELVYTTRCSKERGLMRFRIGGDSEPELLREHPAGIEQPNFSYDGRFLAYNTWESGEVSIEVVDYPNMNSRHLVARTESNLRWSRDGKECFYISKDNLSMTAVELEPSSGFAIKAERTLFDVSVLGASYYSDFDVSGDGQEFYLVRQPQGVKNFNMFTVVENWFEEFRE
jgi:TolB protein